jgi:hypothetical protein
MIPAVARWGRAVRPFWIPTACIKRVVGGDRPRSARYQDRGIHAVWRTSRVAGVIVIFMNGVVVVYTDV